MSDLLDMFESDHGYNDPGYGPSDGDIPDKPLQILKEVDKSAAYSPYYGFTGKTEDGFYSFEASGCSCGVGTTVSGPFTTAEEAENHLSEYLREELKRRP